MCDAATAAAAAAAAAKPRPLGRVRIQSPRILSINQISHHHQQQQ